MSLKEKIISKKAVIGVVGLGYVGLPLAVEYANKGFKTYGIDVDKKKIDSLKKRINYILDIPKEDFDKAISSGNFSATENYSIVKDLDVIFICVPTPFTKNKEPDISYIVDASKNIAKYLKKDKIVILKSTTFPNTTEGYVQPILESTGLKVGKDFYLAFSPERIDPGNKVFTTANTPVVVGGVTKKCTELSALITSQAIAKVHTVSSPKVAEMEKLLENIFRSVNIALVNELARLCDRMGGINMWEVVEAASTKPFGFMPFYPGPGIGGHCILIDPYYLSWQAREFDFQTKFIELAAETNENMPFYVRNLILREISKMPKTHKDAKILFLGAAFKKNVDDTRHSPAIRVMELMIAEGAKNVYYTDPYVKEITVNNKIYKSKPLNEKLLKESHIVVITTDHDCFDYDLVVKNSKCIIDTRNALKNIKNKKAKIKLLGDGK
ncbi:MAG TPA: nucleotide sugar dehydrogenase [Candidatus Paceibacterota bacterium]|nr:nucleotide sugar dehydrogenase [Candidatus Paceibacterota bacterium]